MSTEENSNLVSIHPNLENLKRHTFTSCIREGFRMEEFEATKADNETIEVRVLIRKV